MSTQPKLYPLNMRAVTAMQLTVGDKLHEDNSVAIAEWCGGHIQWTYNSETQEKGVKIFVDWDVENGHHRGGVALPGDWIVFGHFGPWTNRDTEWTVLPDEVFPLMYDTRDRKPANVCHNCLARPDETRVEETPEYTTCPVCGSSYVGPPRGMEYELLVAGGFVSNKEGE